MRLPLLLLSTLFLFVPRPAAQDAKPAGEGTKAANSLGEVMTDVTDKTADAAVAWTRFLAGGCKSPADFFGTGEHAEAELLLAGAIESAVKGAVAGLAGKKGKVKLNDAAEGLVTKVGDDGITLNLNKVETLVAWCDVDPKNLSILISRGKSTAEPDLAAMALLRLLSGEPGDAKKQAAKLTTDVGKKLGDLVDFSKALLPELKVARALESALRDPNPARALEKLKAAWPDAKATQLGEQLKKRLHEQYVARGEKAYAGQTALNGLVHGKVTVNPAKASPFAGAGGVGLEIEYEFEKDSEGADFDVASMPDFLLSTLKRLTRGGGTAAVPFKVNQSRLNASGMNGGVLPIDFAGDLEIEAIGGLREDLSGNRIGMLAIGFATDDGSEQVYLRQQCILETTVAGKSGPSAEKNVEFHPGTQVDAVLRYAGDKLSISANGEMTTPLNFSLKKPVRIFVLAVPTPDWYIERLVIKGTITAASLGNLAHVLADRQAIALFGE